MQKDMKIWFIVCGWYYDRIDEFKNPAEAILIISQYQYEYGFVLDKEICIMAMLLQLKETTKKQLI